MAEQPQASGEQRSLVGKFLVELNQRRVLRSVATYAVAAFVGLQLLDATGDALLMPQRVQTGIAVLVLIGFPVVFVLSWIVQWTDEGPRIQRSSLLGRGQSIALFCVMLVLTAGLALGLYNFYHRLLNDDIAESAVAESAPLVSGQDGAAAPAGEAPANSIAVLPFVDLSIQGDQAYLSDGIAEEILNLLAQVDGLRVAARTSSFAFKGQDQDIKNIGRALNVAKVLEGSVRKQGDRVRLTAQLIDVDTGYHLWSENYDREMTDIFAIQDDVAREIADALQAEFSSVVPLRSANATTTSQEAYEAYRVGRQHWWKRTPDDLKKAVDLFAQAIQADASFAPAYAGLADAFLLSANYGNLSPTVALQRAQPAIERALELDPQSAEAFASLGLARWRIGQYQSAESHLKQSIELNENYTPAYLWLAGLLGEQGREEEEMEVLQQALLRDPLNPLLNNNLAASYMMHGDYAAGAELLKAIVDADPQATLARRSLADWSQGYGRLVPAWRWATEAVELQPSDALSLTRLGQINLDLGRIEAAESNLRAARDLAGNNINVEEAWFFFNLIQGRVTEAERLLGTEEQFPTSDPALLPKRRSDLFRRGMLALIHTDYAAAKDYFRRAREVDQEANPDQMTNLILLEAFAAHQSGADEDAKTLTDLASQSIQNARERGNAMPWLDFAEAEVSVLRNDTDQALDLLEKAYRGGYRQSWYLDLDPMLEPVRDLPRFVQLREAMRQDVDLAREEVERLVALL